MIIPIPPTHWIKQRQNRSAFEWDSISIIIVAPVVVKPDMDSKRALTGEKPLNKKGNAPNTAAASQAKATMAKLSRFFSSSEPWFLYPSINPATDVIMPE